MTAVLIRLAIVIHVLCTVVALFGVYIVWLVVPDTWRLHWSVVYLFVFVVWVLFGTPHIRRNISAWFDSDPIKTFVSIVWFDITVAVTFILAAQQHWDLFRALMFLGSVGAAPVIILFGANRIYRWVSKIA